MTTQTIAFTDNPAAQDKQQDYLIIEVLVAPVIESWKASLFSYEWLERDGSIRDLNDLPIREREKRKAVEAALNKGEALRRPLLGIGLMDNIEIGSAKDVFLTLAALGHKTIPVHIPKSNADEFGAYKA